MISVTSYETQNTPDALLDVVSLGMTGCSTSSRSLTSDFSSSSDQGFLFFPFFAGLLVNPGVFLCLGVPDKSWTHVF